DLLGSARDHVQQAGGASVVADRCQVDDDGDVVASRPVWRQQCSSTPITWTPSKRPGSLTSSCRPAFNTASLTACQEEAREAAIRPMASLSITRLFSAHSTACRVSFVLGAAAVEVCWRHTRAQPGQR